MPGLWRLHSRGNGSAIILLNPSSCNAQILLSPAPKRAWQGPGSGPNSGYTGRSRGGAPPAGVPESEMSDCRQPADNGVIERIALLAS